MVFTNLQLTIINQKRTIMKKTILGIIALLVIAIIASYPKVENDAVWLNGTVIVKKVNIESYTDGLKRTSITGATYSLSNNTTLSYNRENDTWRIHGRKEGFTIFTSGYASKEVDFPTSLDFRTLKEGDILHIEGKSITKNVQL